jgi:hypothetical protein
VRGTAVLNCIILIVKEHVRVTSRYAVLLQLLKGGEGEMVSESVLVL